MHIPESYHQSISNFAPITTKLIQYAFHQGPRLRRCRSISCHRPGSHRKRSQRSKFRPRWRDKQCGLKCAFSSRLLSFQQRSWCLVFPLQRSVKPELERVLGSILSLIRKRHISAFEPDERLIIALKQHLQLGQLKSLIC